MVGRFVEHQEFRAAHQELGQRDTHPDAAGKLGDVARQVGLAEAQPEQHRLGAAVGLVEAVAFQFAQHVTELGQRGVVSGAAMMLCQHLFELDPAAVELEHLAQCRERFVQRRAGRPFRARPAAGSRPTSAAGARYGRRRAR